MAREDVNVKVSANVAEALRLWKAMEEGPKGMATELQTLGQKGKRSTNDMATALDGLIGKWSMVAEGINHAKRLLDEWIQANREARMESLGATRQFEESFSRLQVQAGIPLRSQQADQARARIQEVAQRRALDPNEVTSMATQMVSSGVPLDEVLNGGALDELGGFVNAVNARRPDINKEQLTKQIMLYIQATGQKLNRETIAREGMEIFNLYAGTNMQADALGHYSSEAGKVTALTGFSSREQKALFAMGLGRADHAKVSTSQRSALESLATAGANNTKIAGLEALGLQPEDVDAVGEDATTVFQRIRKGAGGLDRAQRNIAFQRLFGTEGSLMANMILEPGFEQEWQKMLSIQGNAFEYQKAKTTAEQNDAAQLRRQEIRKQNLIQNKDLLNDSARDLAIENDLREQGYSEMRLRRTRAAKELVQDAGAGNIFDSDNVVGRAWSGLQSNPSPNQNQHGRQSQEPVEVKVKVQLEDSAGVRVPHRIEAEQIDQQLTRREAAAWRAGGF